MERVFVSHPYADDPEANKIKAEKICKDLLAGGMLPVSPLHLFSFMDDDTPREAIMEVCFDLIDKCDAVYVYGRSDGCRKEAEYAIMTGKPMRYFGGV